MPRRRGSPALLLLVTLAAGCTTLPEAEGDAPRDAAEETAAADAAPAVVEPRAEVEAAPQSPAEEDAEVAALLSEFEEAEAVPPDPLEPGNRRVFQLNQLMDDWLFAPAARFYAWVVPYPARRSVLNFFSNLNLPSTFVNEVLQLDPDGAGRTGARFVINSTMGVAGLFDPADRFGFDERHADFGQTLGRYGVGAGPYLVLPVVGASTIRDAVGTIVDAGLRPDIWLLTPAGNVLVTAGAGLATREDYLNELAELERSSIDFYAAIRHLYLEARERAVERARAGAWRPFEEEEEEPTSGGDASDALAPEMPPAH